MSFDLAVLILTAEGYLCHRSKYMIDDAFATMNKMGGKVARVWSSASQGCALCVEPELGRFNERALRQLDYVVCSAGWHHVRLILLFVDNCLNIPDDP